MGVGSYFIWNREGVERRGIDYVNNLKYKLKL